MPQRICSYDGCNDRHRGLGYCRKHLERFKKYGDPSIVKRVHRASFLLCTFDGCKNPHDSRGFCTTHWARWKKYGDPSIVKGPHRKYPPICTVKDCDKTHLARGYCSKHWELWNRHGDPLIGGHPVVPSYGQLHKRIKKTRGKAGDYPCVDCGDNAWQWSLNHQRAAEHILEGESGGRTLLYSSDLLDYDPRCVKCHRKYDNRG